MAVNVVVIQKLKDAWYKRVSLRCRDIFHTSSVLSTRCPLFYSLFYCMLDIRNITLNRPHILPQKIYS